MRVLGGALVVFVVGLLLTPILLPWVALAVVYKIVAMPFTMLRGGK